MENMNDEQEHSLHLLGNLPLSEKYRHHLKLWINTYLDEATLHNILSYELSQDQDQPVESVTSQAEKDLEFASLHATEKERTDPDILYFQGNLLFLFSSLLSKIEK